LHVAKAKKLVVESALASCCSKLYFRDKCENFKIYYMAPEPQN